MRLSNAIFSNHKSESNLDGEVLATLEGLKYLNQRVSAISEKIQNTNFPTAINCLNTMESGIQATVACKSTPALNRG
jgi:hypothetical protein